MKILLIRHGSTGIPQSVVKGQTNPSLSSKGRQCIEDISERIDSEVASDLQRIYSSDLDRASQTARILSDSFETPFETTPLLREIDYGNLEGGNLQDYLEKNPEYSISEYGARALGLKFPNGESGLDVLNRLQKAFKFINHNHDQNDTICIVSHITPLNFIVVLSNQEKIPTKFDRFETGDYKIEDVEIQKLIQNIKSVKTKIE